jgi:transposase
LFIELNDTGGSKDDFSKWEIRDNMIIGVDLGDKKSHFAAMVPESEDVVEEGTLPTTKTAFVRKFSNLPKSRVVIEAGAHSAWVQRLLKEHSHEVIVANPRKVQLICRNVGKSDERDAVLLARLGRFDPALLHPIKHGSEETQAHRAVLQARDGLVRARTGLINQVRGLVKSYGERIPTCSADAFHRKAPEAIPEALHPALVPLTEIIGQLTQQIHDYDKALQRLCDDCYPETELLCGVQGVGPITSLAFILILEDAGRFEKSRDVGVYLGLTPRRDQSGDRDPQLKITKAGNGYLRRLLVSCAQYILGNQNKQDSELRKWGLKLAGPMNAHGKYNKRLKKRAVVAVGRKLAVILHTLWTTGEVYDPFYQRTQRNYRKEAA